MLPVFFLFSDHFVVTILIKENLQNAKLEVVDGIIGIAGNQINKLFISTCAIAIYVC